MCAKTYTELCGIKKSPQDGPEGRPAGFQRSPKPLGGIREAPKRFSNDEPPQQDLRRTGKRVRNARRERG
eukprot:3980268-Pyramimonas_sp.AAC.1